MFLDLEEDYKIRINGTDLYESIGGLTWLLHTHRPTTIQRKELNHTNVKGSIVRDIQLRKRTQLCTFIDEWFYLP
jgi:hypothetical protein